MNRSERRRKKKTGGNAASNLPLTQGKNSPPDEHAVPNLQVIDLAVQHYRKGHSHRAESICQQILKTDPNHPEALNLLAVISSSKNKHEIALELVAKVISIKPDYAEAHNNLGTFMRKMERLDEAIISYKKAIELAPDFAVAHNNLGSALNEIGKKDEAANHLHRALTINPNYTDAHSNLGAVLKDLGRFEEAILSYDRVNTRYTRAKTLECLFALERYEDFYESLKNMIDVDKNDLRAAAISAFASQQLCRTDPHPFCKNPMDFIRVYKGLMSLDNNNMSLHQLVNEVKSHAKIWEPTGKTTNKGFQSPSTSNLFSNPVGQLALLYNIIRDTIKDYRSNFSSKDCAYIKFFPKQLFLSGWVVRLSNGGHQTEHLHPDGWLSGVVYLQIPEDIREDEGSIEFGLWGYSYPILNENYPRKRIYPEKGDVILFPSSLFHKTIPFHSNEERICISFDLIPT